MGRRQLISAEEAVDAKCQHEKACTDCPFARWSLNGWLGGIAKEDWLRAAHSDQPIECHTLRGAQCAGLAIYRANVSKMARPPALVLGRDPVSVFAAPAEFLDHHSRLPHGLPAA